MGISNSELIVNPQGTTYHLNLSPDQLANSIILVGDPDRVEMVSKYFDQVEYKVHKREFYSHTGTYRSKPLTVVSTGIGTDNIDIVLNELDALVNIDLQNRTIRDPLKKLTLIRIGTSGSLQPDIPVDSLLLSTYALGLDGLLSHYNSQSILEKDVGEDFAKFTCYSDRMATPYFVKASDSLLDHFYDNEIFRGITVTTSGFYGPQGRILRLQVTDKNLIDKIAKFTYKGFQVTNMEMETSAIYGLSRMLGHRACSINAIIANRRSYTFSKNPQRIIDRAIQYTLDKLASL